MTFGEKIKELRKVQDWTQEELANKISTDKRQVSLYENDKYLPSIDTVINISKVFNISIDYLLFEDIPKHNLYSDYSFFQKLEDLEKLSNNDKQIIIDLINSLAEKNQIRTLAMNMQ